MKSDWQRMRFDEAFWVNPQRLLRVNSEAPHVAMEALATFARTFHVSRRKDYSGSGSKFRNGDTLLARITPCLENGKTAFVSCLAKDEVAHGSTEFIVLSGRPEVSDDLFAYYVAISAEFRSYAIGQMSGTSGRQRVPTEAIARYMFNLPSLPEQRAIARILGSLDDKIELNRRMNATLELLAQTLFRAWFVDFEPVKAKAAGLAPVGLDAETAALFPAEFENGLPKGWKMATIGEMFDVTMGQSPPGESYNSNGEGMIFYQGRSDFGFRFPTPRIYCSAPARLAQKGDTLLSVRAPVGDVNVADANCCVGRGVASLRHKQKALSFGYYLFQNLRSKLDNFNSEGTVFGSINQTALKSLPFVAPPEKLAAAAEEILSSLDAQIAANAEQSRTLSQIRDALLPRLISGQLRVPDADSTHQLLSA